MLSEELVRVVIERGIQSPIKMAVDAGHWPAALVLTYSAIDTMAFLHMPAEKTDVMRSDFIAWAERYLTDAFREEISGRDLYATRCSVLHGGAQSRLSRGGECRVISHADTEQLGAGAFRVGVQEIVGTVFAGIERFLEEVKSDPSRAAVVNARLRYLVSAMPYREDGT
ncbi:MAG: hypothetical protein JO061_03705 [Acidobacteriaceae bacterium]|nr:hypothetical protein [Acidobacteriaceae bacterium]